MTSVTVPYAAYLRVYQPLAAFPQAERDVWEKYVVSADVPDRSSAIIAERSEALLNLLGLPPQVVPRQESSEAFVLVVDGQPLVCPWQVRLRCWLALEELGERLPESMVAVFVPPAVYAGAMADLQGWREEHATAVPTILTSAWHVPVRWFAAFSDDERVLHLGEERSMYFRTPMVEARRRVARTLRVLRKTVADGALMDGVAELGRWLEEFHPRSYVELDYGGLVHLIDDDLLTHDHSAQDVAEGLAALARGDATAATRVYERMLGRWRHLRALERAS